MLSAMNLVRSRSLSIVVVLALALIVAVTSTSPVSASSEASRFVPVIPSRVLDTRDGIGAPAGARAADSRTTLRVAGAGPLPGDAVVAPTNGAGDFVGSGSLAQSWGASTDGGAAGELSRLITGFVVGGSAAASGELPWMTFLLVQRGSGGFAECGGSLIAPRWVLTAAHCVVDAVAVGAIIGRTVAPTSLSDPEFVFATRSFINAGYVPGLFGVADVALVELAEASSAQTAYLATPSDSPLYTAGTMATVAGWGRTAQGAPESDVLLTGDLPIRSSADCLAAYPSFDTTFNTCAGYSAIEASQPVGACAGDSGGPLFVRSADTQIPRQVGIVSYGVGDCTTLIDPGVYMRVSAFYDGIDNLVGGLPAPPATPPPPPPPSAPAPSEPAEPSGPSPIVTVNPSRVFDSRASGAPRPAGSVTEIVVANRSGVPGDAAGAVLNVTALDATAPGFLSVFPCGTPVPDASNVNYTTGQTVPNTAISKIGTGGRVCVYTSVDSGLIVDVSGYLPSTSDVIVQTPRRLYDTRSIGAPAGSGSVTEIQIAGVSGAPPNPAAVVLNVTALDATAPGFLTVFPCGTSVPDASNVNYTTGQTVPNAVIARVGGNGRVCVFTSATTGLIVDAAGFVPSGSTLQGINPARMYDSRNSSVSAAGSIIEVQITGRSGIPSWASTVVLNVTALEASAPGFLTVFPCGTAVPDASNVNHTTGQTVPNAAVAKIGVNGRVCVFTSVSTGLIVDAAGYAP